MAKKKDYTLLGIAAAIVGVIALASGSKSGWRTSGDGK